MRLGLLPPSAAEVAVSPRLVTKRIFTSCAAAPPVRYQRNVIDGRLETSGRNSPLCHDNNILPTRCITPAHRRTRQTTGLLLLLLRRSTIVAVVVRFIWFILSPYVPIRIHITYNNFVSRSDFDYLKQFDVNPKNCGLLLRWSVGL